MAHHTHALTLTGIAATLVATLAIAPAPAHAQLTVASQNTLHLSDSARGKNKRTEVKRQNGQYDVNLLQEVMKSADLSDVKPGSYLFQDTGLKGVSSYKERYAIVYSKTLTKMNGASMVDYGGKKKFARSPGGTMLKDTNGDYIWFVDFHAVFGKSVYLRRDEAAGMADVFTWFKARAAGGKTTENVVLGGDWNLGATDAGFNAIKKLAVGKMLIVPDVKTSLTRAAAPSEKYDHFVANMDDISLSSCVLTPLPPGRNVQWFRNNVSDHRGIVCTLLVQ